jgi:SAM-dependent methyltransferase
VTKQYDRTYYDRWYRSQRAVITQEWRRRKVHHALAAAEFVLEREVRSVLDIGCGEGAWRADLRRLRPGISYLGIDPSEYAVRRFGLRRNIRRGSFTDLDHLRIPGNFDLIVCADVLAYIPSTDLHRGLVAIRKRARVAYIEAYAESDELVADLDGWHHRSEREYRRAFQRAGLIACGLHCYVSREEQYRLAALERCGA